MFGILGEALFPVELVNKLENNGKGLIEGIKSLVIARIIGEYKSS